MALVASMRGVLVGVGVLVESSAATASKTRGARIVSVELEGSYFTVVWGIHAH